MTTTEQAPGGHLTAEERKALWAELTRPFSPDEIEKLPKNVQRDDRDRGTCQQGSRYSADGVYCGKYHARAVHLDYVGHAGITMRLNEVVGPEGWDFQPFALDADAMPIIGRQFYASLTILGVRKWDLADNYASAQEAYGDALRRCAMRFGIGTYLWSKSDAAAALAAHEEPRQLSVGEQFRADLDALAPAVLDTVRENWPYPGILPENLDEQQREEVRGLVRMAREAAAADEADRKDGAR